MAPRPFRFSAPMPRLEGPPARWREALRRIEDLGFSAVSVSDHFTRGWRMEPVVAMTAAAEATDRLRLLSLVLGNDYRHPVMLHKAMATLDVLSGGRVEIGLGAGWMLSDYQAAGMPYDPAGERVDRLEESLEVLAGLFGPEPFSFTGKHYRIAELDGLPKPVRRPRPPLLVGGGSARVLGIAGRRADIAGISPSYAAGILTPDVALDLVPERVERKLSWLRAGAEAAGRSLDDLELQVSVLLCHVSGDGAGDTRAWLEQVAKGTSAETDPGRLDRSLAVLCGGVARCVDLLQERRERFGVSYWNLTGDPEAVAPVVARLAGT